MQLLVPYLLWSFIACLIGLDISLGKLVDLLLYPDRSFWFLWILFLISIVFVCCQRLADKINVDELLLVGWSACFLFGLMVIFDIRIFGFQFLSYYFLFYTFGYCIHRFPKLQIRNPILVIFPFLLWFFMAWFWNMHELPLWMPNIPYVPHSLLQYVYRGVTAVVALWVIFGIAPRILNVRNLFNRWIKNLGMISLGVYVVHMILLSRVRDSIMFFFPNNPLWLNICIIFVLVLVITVTIVELLMRNKWTKKFLLGKTN